ncbi:hypothetical protein Btru_020635 [Bulinus truncatus]|nr:hypothetical protein Btru_020635 [Bulinus truncatus]
MASFCSQIFDVVTEKDFFDEFNLKEGSVLGAGHGGTVVSASFVDDPESVHAVKKFALHGAESHSHVDQKIITEFSREVNVMKMAVHPRIMPVIAAVKTPTCLALVLPFYINGTLMSAIKTSTRCQQMRYVTQLCQTVQYLHDKNIVHGDIKPKNIMIDDDDNIILSDFGFARHLPNQNVELLINYGTKYYIAPETGSRERVCPFKVDMYALGVTLWSIMLKKEPFQCPDLIEELNNTPDIPELYRSVIAAMLDVDPDNRPLFSEMP